MYECTSALLNVGYNTRVQDQPCSNIKWSYWTRKKNFDPKEFTPGFMFRKYENLKLHITFWTVKSHQFSLYHNALEPKHKFHQNRFRFLVYWIQPQCEPTLSVFKSILKLGWGPKPKKLQNRVIWLIVKRKTLDSKSFPRVQVLVVNNEMVLM